MTARFAGNVSLNKMAKADYTLVEAADGSGSVYMLDKPMLNETGNILVYPFGFEPTYHRYRMDTLDKLKMGNNVFVGAMADMFGEWVPDAWLDEIFEVCTQRSIHNYLFLTKNPKRYEQYCVPKKENMWYGTTITKKNELIKVMYLPAGCRKYVSIEPLMEDIEPENNAPMFRCVDWVIVGAETGHRKNKIIPKKEWIEHIVKICDESEVPVFMKDSLIPIVGENNIRRNFPKQLQHSTISPKMQKKLFDICAECKVQMKKSDMITLLARSKRGEQPKQFGFMCKECFRKFCKELEIDIPSLEALVKEADVSVTFGLDTRDANDDFIEC